MPDATASTRSGPFRSEAARRKILSATVELLSELGYDHLTIEGIAARAGVGKQTIYRWWKSKSAILAECLLEGLVFPGELEIPDTGDIRSDLRAWLRSVGRALGGEHGDVLFRALIAAATENVDVGRRLRDSISGAGVLSARLSAAAGTAPLLPADAPVNEIAESLIGAIILRALSRSPLDDATVDALITAALGADPHR